MFTGLPRERRLRIDSVQRGAFRQPPFILTISIGEAAKPMAARTQRKTVSFAHPFVMKGIDRVLPPGNYVVVTDEELLEGM